MNEVTVAHNGRSDKVIERRKQTLQQASSQHPERFVHGIPQAPAPPHEGLDQSTDCGPDTAARSLI